MILLILAMLQAADGAAIYKQRCAICHDVSETTRAPNPAALKAMSPENIVRALDVGLMKQQAASMSAAEKRTIAEYLTGKAIGSLSAASKVGACTGTSAAVTPTSTDWNGWGADAANTRFQTAQRAGLNADQASRLKLKWAFAFPNTASASALPVVVGGRVFVASSNRNVYSLDARTGCVYWTFEPESPVRTAIVIASVGKRQVAFFGDARAGAYAVDAMSGELLWKARVDDHPRAKIVGGFAYASGRIFVPVTAGEEGPSMDPAYACCSARGSLVALDAGTGKQIWKTYSIAETPHVTGKSAAGTATWGPSGASIWSAPTIDEKRKIVYAGTGDNFSDPATKTSDAVIAFDMETGKLLWSKQLTEGDVYNMGCRLEAKVNCPEKLGPDFDIGASPILVTAANGKRVLLVSQKSGVATGLDADHNGDILWQTRVGRGGTLGGIQWGAASDSRNMYVAVSDITFTAQSTNTRRRVVDPTFGGGLFALDIVTGAKVWSAAPPPCGERPNCSPSQSAAVSAIPGVVFSASLDAHLRGYSTSDGKIIWDFDTAADFTTVNGLTAKGGSMDGAGPTIANGMVYVSSGYGAWGGLPGNVLLAFSVDGK